MRTIAVVNQKGGVAKTTTAVNLAVGMAAEGKRVLLVDLDPQAHATLALRVESQDTLAEKTVARLFYDGQIADVAVPTGEAGLDLIPASIHLAVAVETLYAVIFREIKLKKALDGVRDTYDYVLLDSGPNLGVLSVNALVAADCILIPSRLSMYSLDGLSALLDTMGRVKEPGAEYDWRILLTMVKGYGKERQAAAWNLLEPLQDRILATQIRETEAVEKSQLRDEEDEGPMAVVLERASRNRGAQDYKALVREVLDIWPA